MIRFTLSILLFTVSTAIYSVDIVNKDKVSYRISYDDAGTQHNEILNPGKKMNSICGECTVRISGLGSFRAAGSEKIIIQNGEVTVE
ncbi:hypothetical protein [Leptospira stimsonii]|uniref:Uncharacterized protein n=1 Tax=Leptospira stimsonii TaxID=2202203 RepID=A0A4R9L3Z7_9LEPT|nr:hypothetical protein [Leptospira stimsonii]RHX85108.1 hypothetical protein DLM75_21780 [Leptospira stimsonii]RHX85337.1 hypothetical protein DLM78_14605 [Leptospira stimsonii]TGK15754.1 hypothetical protein EHO98_14070 [Leptospira stimsonii]TGM13571.1 hypothetical protein EHQ90_13480 [Leptospira stimsonii]